MSLIIAKTGKEILRCYPVMAQLRPHVSKSEFMRRVERQAREGYSLAFLEDAGRIVCVAGFRLMNMLAWGKLLYVDDLVTDERERSKGYGQQMFAWLLEHAKANDCAELHLDSGVQRFGAHRFYLASGMDITLHHFALKLKP
jgi:GNAT superfamily N-acetyltransferase